MTTREEVERLADQLRGEGDAHFSGNVRDRRTVGAIMSAGGDMLRSLLSAKEAAEWGHGQEKRLRLEMIEMEQAATARAKKAEADLAEARARNAALIEMAAQGVANMTGVTESGSEFVEQHLAVIRIRTLATPDETGVLERVRAEARLDGISKAGTALSSLIPDSDCREAAKRMKNIAAAIREGK
jgi:hypothetical protein